VRRIKTIVSWSIIFVLSIECIEMYNTGCADALPATPSYNPQSFVSDTFMLVEVDDKAEAIHSYSDVGFTILLDLAIQNRYLGVSHNSEVQITEPFFSTCLVSFFSPLVI
jgi:hypothetical protein